MVQSRKGIVSEFIHLVIALLAVGTAFHSMSVTPAAQTQSAPTVTDSPVISSMQADPRDEPAIAVSRTNPQVIVGASKWVEGGASGNGNARVAYYYSSDSGHTWGTGVLPLETPQKTWSRAASATIASDLNGTFYLCALMLDNSSFDTGIYVFKSSDNGHTFTSPVPVALDIGSSTAPKLAKQPRLAVDTTATSRFKNTVYAVWVSVEPDRTVVLTNHWRSGDDGFSAPKTISHNGDMRSPSITTGPKGELYAVWEGIGDPKRIYFNESLDGGETFLPPAAAPQTDAYIYDYVGSLSDPNASLIIRPVRRMNSYPVIDVDRSNGANRGMIYVAWAEARNHIDADVLIARMPPPNGDHPNMGHPLNVVRVNNDGAGADQFFPRLSVDPANGQVEVAFYDRRNDPAGSTLDVYLARSTDGGESFAENLRVSSAGFDATIQSSVVQAGSASLIGLGDYIALEALDGKANLMWADTRRGAQEIFYGNVAFEPSGGGGGGGGGGGDSTNNNCATPRVISSVPFQDEMDTRAATISADDPATCAGGQGMASVWYSVTPTANTTLGVDTSGSDYDTVVSVYTGSCGALTAVACDDDFANAATAKSRALLTFQASAGNTYLIEITGKGSGSLNLRVGYPTITAVEFPPAAKGSEVLKITGSGFSENNVSVAMSMDGSEITLPTVTFSGQRQGDGTFNEITATRKKLRKKLRSGDTVIVTVESPTGSGRVSNRYLFTRP
ncbi:MAG: sialidase family protein [Blastocatellia bacterium]